MLLHTAFDKFAPAGDDDVDPRPAVCQKAPAGGYVELVDWDGTVLASYHDSDVSGCQHHDALRLPSGNVLYPRYEPRSAAECAAAGCASPEARAADSLVEVNVTSGEVVWTWRIWDHLVQDVNASADNYATSITDHPELLDVNVKGESEGAIYRQRARESERGAAERTAQKESLSPSSGEVGQKMNNGLVSLAPPLARSLTF